MSNRTLELQSHSREHSDPPLVFLHQRVESDPPLEFLQPDPPVVLQVDESSGVNKTSGESSWLVVTIGRNDLAGSQKQASVPNGPTVSFAVPHYTTVGDKLTVNNNGHIVQINGNDITAAQMFDGVPPPAPSGFFSPPPPAPIPPSAFKSPSPPAASKIKKKVRFSVQEPVKKRRLSSRDLMKQANESSRKARSVRVQNKSTKPSAKNRTTRSSRSLMRQHSKTTARSGLSSTTSTATSSSPAPRTQEVDMMDDGIDPERTLFSGFWPDRGICCCQGVSSKTVGKGAGASRSLEKKAHSIEITDHHVIYKTTKKLMSCCAFGGCPQINTQTSLVDGLNAIIVREDDNAGRYGMFVMYLVWFCFGIFGGHYWFKRKLFAQTRTHRLFLFLYLITLGGGGLFWLIDGFRVGNWVGGYTVLFQ